MIIIKLSGGLGNQLFQYALGRKKSIQNEDVFKLDISAYTKDYARKYKLGVFNIIENIATSEEIKKLKIPLGLFSRIIRGFKFKILRIHNIGFKSAVLKKKGNMYLDGYWQSELYFTDIRETLLKDFTLKSEPGTEAKGWIEKITSIQTPVSLHIRRGDYVQDTKTNSYHGVCDLSYYTNAYQRLVEKGVNNIHMIVFSDDLEWVRENLELPCPMSFVSGSNIQDYEELVLMSKCHHNIIANSSFSWWGAWLNPRVDKIVIAPQQWFKKDPQLYKDIVPETWIKI